MKTLKFGLWASLLGLSVLWWWVDPTDWSQLNGFFAWRNVLNQYSGVLGLGVMSLAMMLSVRPVFLERHVDGLDKIYRLHKWLGIAALVFSVSHWLIAKGPKWLVALGWLERRGRRERPSFPEGSWQHFFMDQRGLAETIGEWAFYLAVVLMVLALIKRFPYRRFVQTHRLLAVSYLALVWHAIVLIKFDYWSTALAPVLLLLMLGGSVAAIMALRGKRLGGKTAAGYVQALEYQPALGVLAVDIQMAEGWPGHQAGQFAFVTFHQDEGAHPFTIASAWQHDGRIRFLIKALGDYTRTLPDRLKIGDRVRLEGPYGQFNFAGSQARQIWIGGGIGISPFVARMKALAEQGDGATVDLFHSTTVYDPAVLQRLADDAARAGVKLHVLWDERDGHLDVDRLVRTVTDWHRADIWFCGPARFGQAMRDGLIALGLPPARFHQEFFEMR